MAAFAIKAWADRQSVTYQECAWSGKGKLLCLSADGAIETHRAREAIFIIAAVVAKDMVARHIDQASIIGKRIKGTLQVPNIDLAGPGGILFALAYITHSITIYNDAVRWETGAKSAHVGNVMQSKPWPGRCNRVSGTRSYDAGHCWA
jgi:hypothetical protein